MLYDISKRLVAYIPHEVDHNRWRNRLTAQEYDDIIEEIWKRVGDQKIFNASFLPGADWTGTPFQTIYEKACDYDEKQAALCYGLFCWVAMQRHGDSWYFYKQEGTNLGTTYFRMNQ